MLSLWDVLEGNCYLGFILIPKDSREIGWSGFDLLELLAEVILLVRGSI